MFCFVKVKDWTAGANHWYSPRSMPKEGDSCKGFDCSGGLEQTEGLSKRNYRPGWAAKCPYINIAGVRPAYFKFHRC